ncbi:MAG: hypothetical protein RLY73_813, partial [Pseudomonadota bacterium]
MNIDIDKIIKEEDETPMHIEKETPISK